MKVLTLQIKQFHLRADGRDIHEISVAVLDQVIAISGDVSESSGGQAIEAIRSTGVNAEDALKSLVDDALSEIDLHGALPQSAEIMHADWVTNEVRSWGYLRFDDHPARRITSIIRDAFDLQAHDGHLTAIFDVSIQWTDWS